MKKILIIISVLFIILFVYLIFVKPDNSIKNTPVKNNQIVALGDSLVEGVGATSGNDFVSRLSTDLIDGQIIQSPIINLGVSGNTTADGLKRIDQVLELDPGVVIVLLGGNDFIRRVPIDETRKNLINIIETLQTSGAAVVLLGVRGGLVNDDYKSMYSELAKNYQTGYVSNVLSGLITNPELMSDAIHPNDAGYKIIADRVVPEVVRVLNVE